jgi:hypothetical protein
VLGERRAEGLGDGLTEGGRLVEGKDLHLTHLTALRAVWSTSSFRVSSTSSGRNRKR